MAYKYVNESGDEATVRGLTVSVELGEKTKSEILKKVREVREYADAVEAENAKLRELLDDLHGKAPTSWHYGALVSENECTKTENAKLRELVGNAHKLLNEFCENQHERGCDCPAWPDHDRQCSLRDIEDDMTKMGIKV